MAHPTDRLYTAEHEWVLIAPGTADSDLPSKPVRIGLTTFALDALATWCSSTFRRPAPPSPRAMPVVRSSPPSPSPTCTPRSPVVAEVNQAIVDDPALIAADPYAGGWLFSVRAEATAKLLTSGEYEALLD